MDLGQIYRFEVDTTPETAATYAKYSNEVSCSLNIEGNEIPVADKDQGDWEGFIKGRLKGLLSLTINENRSPNGTDLNMTDALALQMETHSNNNGGKRLMRITTAKSNGLVFTFLAAFMKVSINFEDQGLVNYTVDVKIDGEVTVTPVA